jgi:OOP family OmpA-OmpF porin
MKLFLLICFLFSLNVIQAQKLSGTWQGLYSSENADNSADAQRSWIYLDMTIVKGMIDGKIRHEDFSLHQYYIYDIVGKVLPDGQLEISESTVSQKSKNAVMPAKQQYSLQFDAKKGYLIGTVKNGKSKLTLYRANFNIQENTPNILTENQLDKFQQELKDGISSPEKRLEELKAFKFDPIYFDYGKDSVKKEYEAYLIEMIRMVKSHSDLRILITGHTDSDGSDAYNFGLSQRRAAALLHFFEQHGLPKSRVEIDFKGEKEPVDRNDTPEGKQKNRRVDFRFV